MTLSRGGIQNLGDKEPSRRREEFDCGVICSICAAVGDVMCIGTRGIAKSRRKVHCISSFAVVNLVKI